MIVEPGERNREWTWTGQTDVMVVVERAKPKTSGRFASLMELYENNYMQLRLLIPQLRALNEGLYVSRVEGCLDLELSQIEQNRYTTTFNLSYRFSQRMRGAREPDLTIRLYHDARTCEVVTGLIRTGRSDQRKSRNLDESWRLNRFLHKWVSYCIRQGHGFDGARTEAEGAVSA